MPYRVWVEEADWEGSYFVEEKYFLRKENAEKWRDYWENIYDSLEKSYHINISSFDLLDDKGDDIELLPYGFIFHGSVSYYERPDDTIEREFDIHDEDVKPQPCLPLVAIEREHEDYIDFVVYLSATSIHAAREEAERMVMEKLGEA